MHNFYEGQILDFNSDPDKQILEDLADPTAFNCTAGTFQSDSWIPTIASPPQEIPCKFPAAANVDDTICSSSSIVQNSSSGCYGCIESQSVLSIISGNINSDLQARYPSADCTDWIDWMENVWDNFYSIK